MFNFKIKKSDNLPGSGVFVTQYATKPTIDFNKGGTICSMRIRIWGTFQPNFNFYFSDSCLIKIGAGQKFHAKVFANKKMTQNISIFKMKYAPFVTTVTIKLPSGVPFEAISDDASWELFTHFEYKDSKFNAIAEFTTLNQ